MAEEISGDAIFGKQNPRVEKIDKALESAESAMAAEFRQAKIRNLRGRVKAYAKALDALTAESAAATRENDSKGLIAVTEKKEQVTAKLTSLRQALEAETGVEEPIHSASTEEAAASESTASEAGKPAGPAVAPKAKPKPATAAPIANPASADAPATEASAFVIGADEVPRAMLGKWKRVENGKVCGFYLLVSGGQLKTYKSFKANGSPEIMGGTWRVSNTGEVTLMPDAGDGQDTQRVSLVGEGKASGAHWVRKTEGAPYREGDKVEWVREGK